MKLWRKEKSIIYALHPARIPACGAQPTYTLGLGGIAVLTFAVTVVTGIVLCFYYVPTPADAYSSIIVISDVASFGSVIRAVHYWSAQAMVVAVTLHLARVVFTGGYKPPRRFNWLVGVSLLVLTLVWDFTGYALRWDTGGFWALLVGTNLLREIPALGEPVYRAIVGDRQISAITLLRFYGWHVVGLTVVGLYGVVYHLWRLRRDGGISTPALKPGETREFVSRGDLFFREFVAGAFVCAALVFIALLAPAPLGRAANPDISVSAVRAPWVFLWVQDLLRVLPPFWAGVFAPTLVLLVIAGLPWLERGAEGRGIWLARECWKAQVVLTVVALILTVLSLHEVLR